MPVENFEIPVIRHAHLSDLDKLLEFEQEIIKAERPFDSTLKDDPIHYYDLKQMIIEPDAEVVVALAEDRIIGSGFAHIEKSKSYLKHTRYALLCFMYVKPHYRGKGINKEIIEALKRWATKQGITEFRLTVYQDNDAAISAYEKAGFRKHLIEMRMNIEDDKM